jgi:2-polyprenyl-6-methoxyphenol hydroxylase-like FAD-dependent oxidoreductase
MWSVGIRFERALATAFGRGRIWLAGDAAHLAFPFGVRSMNEGIVEAQDLAQRCAQVLAGQASLASLASYGNERLVRWRALVAAAKSVAPAGMVPIDPWLTANAGRIVEALPVATIEGAELLARIAA